VHTDELHFEWDAEKARTNWQKHGVSFGQAQEVFSDSLAVLIEDPFPFEERFSLIGLDSFGRVLVFVFSWRENRLHIISARKATNKERSQYEGE